MKKALGCKAREIGLWELKMGKQMNKMNIEENGQGAEVQNVKTSVPSVPAPVKRKRVRPFNRKQSSASLPPNSSHVVVNEARRNWKDGQVWFSLVAAEDQ